MTMNAFSMHYTVQCSEGLRTRVLLHCNCEIPLQVKKHYHLCESHDGIQNWRDNSHSNMRSQMFRLEEMWRCLWKKYYLFFATTNISILVLLSIRNCCPSSKTPIKILSGENLVSSSVELTGIYNDTVLQLFKKASPPPFPEQPLLRAIKSAYCHLSLLKTTKS